MRLPVALRLPRRTLMQETVEPSDLLHGEHKTNENDAPKQNKRANKKNSRSHAPSEIKTYIIAKRFKRWITSLGAWSAYHATENCYIRTPTALFNNRKKEKNP